MKFGVFDHVDANGMQTGALYAMRLRLVELYDRLGFHCYHMAEHHSTQLGMASSPGVFLSAIAQRTSRIGFGPLVYVLPLHHPVRLLEEIGMLDQLSGGRLQVGVGKGGQPAEHARFGIAPEDIAPLFEESFEILMKGLSGESFSHSGQYFDLPEVPQLVKPLQSPHPQLWYGAGSLHRNAWAAQHRMNLLSLRPNHLAREQFDDYRLQLDQLGVAVGDRPFMGLARNLVVAETDAQAEAIAARVWARFAQSFNWLVHHLGQPGFPLPADFAAARKVGMAFAGSPASVRDWIEAARDEAGITYMALEIVFGDMTEDEAATGATLFAQEVMPHFGT